MKTPAIFLFFLLPMAAPASAIEPYSCRNGHFPSMKPIVPAVVVHDKAYFRNDDKGCPESPSCQGKAYMVKGDQLLVSTVTDEWVCGWYFGAKREFVGWVPRQSVTLATPPAPGPQDWIGIWRPLAGDNEIIIKQGKDGRLEVTGEAFWFGSESNVHTGDLQGSGIPVGATLSIGDKSEQFECHAELRLIAGKLVVTDNSHCGGVNVRFDDIYRKQSKGKPKRRYAPS